MCLPCSKGRDLCPWPALFEMPRKHSKVLGSMSASMRIISGSGVGFLPLHISARGTERKVGRNRRPKRERSGWCCYPMLCQSSWEELERSRSQNLSEPSSSSSTANMSRTHADARKNGGRVAGQSGKGGQLRNFAGWLKKKKREGPCPLPKPCVRLISSPILRQALHG